MCVTKSLSLSRSVCVCVSQYAFQCVCTSVCVSRLSDCVLVWEALKCALDIRTHSGVEEQVIVGIERECHCQPSSAPRTKKQTLLPWHPDEPGVLQQGIGRDTWRERERGRETQTEGG